jgi:uncharacterized iron-regulated membrane protein
VAQSTILRLRGLWLQVHKWIGLLLAVLIIPISVTGSALVWHDWLDEAVNPQRYMVTSQTATRDAGAYASAARAALAPGDRLASIRYPEHEGGPVIASAVPAPAPGAGGGPPARTNVWLDPGSARVLDKASSNAGLVRVLHVLHGSLMVPGWGRTIVGWVGVFMFVSCLTGIWLWWPLTGSVRRGFRWRRQNSTNANIHHLLGFWVLLPLAMLSFTGFWISFPSVFSAFEASQPKAKGKGGAGAPADRARAARARPLEQTSLSLEQALAAARPLATGPLVSIAWPTDQAGEWKFSFQRERGPAEVAVDDATGEVTPPRPPRPETNARLMRRWHDGTGMGAVWQIIIFVGGIIPAILSVTGIVMWLRSRGWRSRLAAKRKAGKLQPAPAE